MASLTPTVTPALVSKPGSVTLRILEICMNDHVHPTAAKAAAASTSLVIFGRDENGKAHASRFSVEDTVQAKQAAALMGMRALRLETAEHETLAAKLPVGRLFESGRAFVPFVKRELYERLMAVAGEPGSANGSQVGSIIQDEVIEPDDLRRRSEALDERVHAGEADTLAEKPPVSTSASEHEQPFLVGETVLAPELEASWWEAIIVAVEDEMVTLKWRDFPKEPPFTRQRYQIAFIPAGYVLPV